ncbi:unnamed protein product [Acanthoscelides obtectus]|uniref:Uncharacterized protein n=1 Tax=Acanthoscelides obtectus TaxID=200917 RepID=A0A9P0Q0U3_ACAOB|nr:unnamed protein product [Acanthoscelides obtectus]CAK1657500.1 hypothetical protein AOBTE_LOCUS20371 [Acanthoscelides obtectus]
MKPKATDDKLPSESEDRTSSLVYEMPM